MKKMNFVILNMIAKWFALSVLGFLTLQVSAQPTLMYQCDGNSYTNVPADMVGKKCKLVQGANFTLVQGNRPPTGTTVKAATPSQTSPNSGQRVDNTEQRARDSDSRVILEAELKKAEAKQAELLKEYNNGEPDKLGPETKNHQKYLDRVAEMKASIARNDSDIAGIKRELGRNTSAAKAN